MKHLNTIRLAVAALGLAVALATAPTAKADQIDRVLAHDADAITKAVRGLKAKNVAVLKFRVKFGDAPPTFQGGSEGVEMLHRIENILVLGLDPKAPEFTILNKAGEIAAAAAKSAKAPIDWTTPEGRKKLLELKLPVLWDDSDLRTADAFVTGTVLVSKDFREVKIELLTFSKADPNLKKLGTLQDSVAGKASGIHTDRAMLASLGQTFSTSRSLKPTGKARDFVLADESAAADADRREDTPGVATTAPNVGPVKLEILLDGYVSTMEPDPTSPGEYKVGVKIARGMAGQRVTFKLQNNHTEKLAVLLCVDGRNTISIDGEDLNDLTKSRSQFRMYVLDPGVKYEIKGFLTNAETGTVNQITVGTEEESAQLYETLNPNTRGKIQMFVYGPKPIKITGGGAGSTTTGETTPLGEDPQTSMDIAEAANGLSTFDRSLGKARSLAAAQNKTIARTNLMTANGRLVTAKPKGRGLFIERKEKNEQTGVVEVVKFYYDEQPLDSLVVSYYTP
jgi:acylphosphatase